MSEMKCQLSAIKVPGPRNTNFNSIEQTSLPGMGDLVSTSLNLILSEIHVFI